MAYFDHKKGGEILANISGVGRAQHIEYQKPFRNSSLLSQSSLLVAFWSFFPLMLDIKAKRLVRHVGHSQFRHLLLSLSNYVLTRKKGLRGLVFEKQSWIFPTDC